MSDEQESIDMSTMTEEEKKQVLEAQARAAQVQKSTSGHRSLQHIGVIVITIIAGMFSVFQIYNVFGGLTALRQRAIHLAFALIICLVKFSANKNKGLKEPWLPYVFVAIGLWTAIILPLKLPMFGTVGILTLLVLFAILYVARMFTEKWRIKNGEEYETHVVWYDYIFIAFSLIGCTYIAVYADDILSRAGIVYIKDQVIGFFLILAVFEATRRSIGYILMYIGLFMLLYCRFGNILPDTSIFWHPGSNLFMIVRHFILTDSGLWSSPLGVCASYIAAFLLLGSSLHASGLAEVMLKTSKGIFGTMVGG
ncbi:MAG: TRAP transporter large permease subunit, partial [Spirochaetaceae bacterium]|nr:TRAP transporter large permease subunit [Spirochaetaceae bacterium]